MVLFGIWGSASNDLYVVGGVATAGDGDAGANRARRWARHPTAAPDATTTYRGGGLALVRWRGELDRPSRTRPQRACCGTCPAPPTARPYTPPATAARWHHTTDHGASWSRSGTTAVAVNDNDYDFTISDVWVSPAGTSYLLEDGSGYVNPDSPYDQHVCRAIDVELDGGLLTQTTGCERLPPSGGFSATPDGRVGHRRRRRRVDRGLFHSLARS